MPDILIVDDDTELCELLVAYLQGEGFTLHTLHDGSEAAAHLQQHAGRYQAIILDSMLPGMQGLDVLQRLRAHAQTPVLMLTARGEDIDRIIGLESGADDYLPKPCNPRELLARLRAVLRRTETISAEDEGASSLSAHGIELDPGTREASCNGVRLDLTSAEFNTLLTLLQHIGEVVSKEKLTEKALNRKFTRYDRSVDVHISSVRRKLAEYLPDRELIKTVRGAGYIMINEADV